MSLQKPPIYSSKESREMQNWFQRIEREVNSTTTGFDESAQDAVGGILTDTATIDFTYDDATPQITADVKTDSIDNTMLANMAQTTVKGRASGAGTGDPTDLTATQLLEIIKTADGTGSGLDADALDGQSGAFYLDSDNFTGTEWTDLTDTGATTLHKHDHGNMDGLSDDDHTQYLLADGTRNLSGNMSVDALVTIDGRDLSVDGTKLDGIESGATADQTAAEILSALLTVDGSGSGLDADLVRGTTPGTTGLALLDDTTAAAAIATLGLDADIATLSLPASTTISTFGASLIDDAAASNARTTLGLVIGTDVQAWDTNLDQIAALAVTDSNFIVGNGSAWVAESGATARTSLGLGSIATQAASSVSITGGSVTGITDITVADGGTGRSSHTAYAVLCGGTTTTAAQQSIASVGTSGQVLTSNGAGALPTFQDLSGLPAGLIAPFGGTSAPTGWLECDGSAVSRTTYAGLFAVISTTWGAGDGSTTFNVPDLRGRVPIGAGTGTLAETCTAANVDTGDDHFDVASNVDTWITGMKVQVSTTTTLPTGLSAATDYWIVRASATTIKFATTLANAQNGTVINLTTQGSGTHTVTHTLSARTEGVKGGEEAHAMSSTELLAHVHTSGSTLQTMNNGVTFNGIRSGNSGSTGGNSAMNNMPPFGVVTYIIKT